MYIYGYPMKIKKNGIEIDKKVLDLYTTEVVKSGNSARINCQKKYLGKKVLVLVLDEEGDKK